MLVWFITGSSRGFGLEIARLALERGYAIVASARDPYQVEAALPGFGDRLLAPALDVTNEDRAREAVAQAMQRYTRIDVLVNNAGRGLLGAVEEVSDDEARDLFETNVFELLTVTRAVMTIMRQQRSGRCSTSARLEGSPPSEPGRASMARQSSPWRASARRCERSWSRSGSGSPSWSPGRSAQTSSTRDRCAWPGGRSRTTRTRS